MRIITRRICAVCAILVIAFYAFPVYAQADLVSLHDIFKDPKIEGNRPRNGSISPDGDWIVFTWTDTKADSIAGLYRAAVENGRPERIKDGFRATYRWLKHTGNTLVFAEKNNLVAIDAGTGEERILAEDIDIKNNFSISPDGGRIVFSNDKGLWIINSNGTELRQLTLYSVSAIQWAESGDDLFFRYKNNIWTVDAFTGHTVRLTDEKEEESGRDYYRRGMRFNLSPDSRYVSYSKYHSNTPKRNIIVPHYVDKKYVWGQRARNSFPDDPYGESSLYLVDVGNEITYEIDLGVNKEFRIRAQNWSPDGSKLHIVLLTADNHDLYQLIVDPKKRSASIIDHEHDDAWIGGPGFYTYWDEKGKNIYFTSERSGYNHIWCIPAGGGEAEQLTSGSWELENVTMTEDKKRLIFQSTEIDPAQRHVYVYDIKSRKKSQVTKNEGMNHIVNVSEDGKQILYMHASTLRPGDYFVAEASGSADERKVSFTIPQEFKDVAWIAPEFVWFNNHNDGMPLYAMRYDPPNLDRSKKYPAVIFVHGAGYIQNTIKGWATYAPNIKFHTRLAQKGYVVLDIDYRGSQGYGRDFRTDVYMHLGGKDLDDEVAGVEYLKTLEYVDTEYVGIYGGSYGGFMTLMALFIEPNVFKAGAALRSVTDWENYNAGYTQQRLGRVSDNKEAYIKSSPVHHAANLKGQLLLMHGLIDDNVFAQDSFQLAERLIELGKTDLFEFMVYPSQRHGFTDPDSWIDEYRRIEKLFDDYLMAKMGGQITDDWKQ